MVLVKTSVFIKLRVLIIAPGKIRRRLSGIETPGMKLLKTALIELGPGENFP